MTTTVTWLGHGCFQLQIAGQTVLIDPFLTGNPAARARRDCRSTVHRLDARPRRPCRRHRRSIAKRTGSACVIANYEITEWLGKQRVSRVHPLNTGGGHSFPFGRLKFTIAHHTSMLPDGSDGGSPCGLLFTLPDGRKIYHAGDTGLFYDMKLIGEEGIDLAILPLGDNYTMGPGRCPARLVKLLNPRRVIPEHFNTWELIAQDPEQWAKRVRDETTQPIDLKPGETFTLP